MTIALARHGTKLAELKPSAIIAAARADLALRSEQFAGARGDGIPIRPYAFHRRHVRRATSVADLIARAIADRYAGYWSSKRATVAIYADPAALEAALVAAREAAA
jgi:hypothetical protein